MKRKHQIKIVVVLIVAVLLFGGVYITMRQMEKQYFSADKTKDQQTRTEEKPEAFQTDVVRGKVKLDGKKYTFSHEIETYLLIGTDASGNQKATGEDYRGTMADFLLLAVVDRTEESYAFLQLNRDTMTRIHLIGTDGTGEATAKLQLCTAHWYGGTRAQSCENTVKAVSQLLGGIPIDGYYELNMEQIPALNKAVGGVTVTIQDDFSKIDSTMKQGTTITLTDEQAYTYVHDRYGVGDEENTSRMKRQRQYMENFLKKAQKLSSQDANFIVDLYKQLEEAAETDITGKQTSRLANRIRRYENKGILSLEGTTKLGQALGDGIDHTEFYPDKQSLIDTMVQLYSLKCEEE